LERALHHALRVGERKGVATVDQLDAALPADFNPSARQIEEFMSALSDKGILVVEGSDELEGP
jgi:hypothetical protein